MNNDNPPKGVEPVADLNEIVVPRQELEKYPGLVLRIRGRTIRLRALRKKPTGILFWLSILGPGLISGAVSNDPGSIATYSQAGAQFGYDLLWFIVIITVSLIVIQEMSARLGAATGRGLLSLIRSEYGIGWALFATVIMLIANFGLVLGEFFGLSSAMNLFGISKFITVPVAAALMCYLVLAGNYNRVEKVFMIMAAVFLTYPVAAFLAHPSLKDVFSGLLVPKIRLDASYILLIVGLAGTTISPYQQIFEQSAVVEKGITRRRFGPERWDSAIGMIFSDLITVFIIIATAATLHVIGKTDINTASDAAKALEPVAGAAAQALFAIGVVGAGLMAGVVVAISTSFAFTGAFGLQEGIGLDIKSAPVFYGLFLFQILVAAILSLLPGLPAFRILVLVQILNGILLPFILVFILLLVNKRRLMGKLKSSKVYTILGWATFALITVSVISGLTLQVLSSFGIQIMGSG